MNYEMISQWILPLLVIWNIFVMLLYGWDKRQAIRHKRRIAEKTLLFCTFAMGSVGAMLGMFAFRHKTKHVKFQILVPICLLCHTTMIFFLR